MNTLVALAVATLVMLAAHPALAQDKTLAIVVKGLDNPFFSRSASAARSGTPRTRARATPASTPARPPAPTRPARCRSSTTC